MKLKTQNREITSPIQHVFPLELEFTNYSDSLFQEAHSTMVDPECIPDRVTSMDD